MDEIKAFKTQNVQQRIIVKKNKWASGGGSCHNRGTHHMLTVVATMVRGGVWWCWLPFLLHYFLFHCPHLWYLARFDRIGYFWPSLQDSLIFKTLKIVLLLIHLGLLSSFLNTNLKQANVKHNRGKRSINIKIKLSPKNESQLLK